MGYYEGHLRNSHIDVAIDSVLLVAIAVACFPQITRIVNGSSTRGVSPYFFLFNATYSNVQLASALYTVAYAYPNGREPALKLVCNGRLRGLAAFGAVLGLLQIALQWACSTFLVILIAGNSSTDRSSMSRSSIAGANFVHAALFLIPAISITLPKPSNISGNFGLSIVAGLSYQINNWIGLFCVVLQFYPQYIEMKRMLGDPGALSLLSLGLQALALTGVAVRWFLRFGSLTEDFIMPPAEELRRAPLMVRWCTIWLEGLWEDYKWAALPINYILHSVGCAVLLRTYLLAGRGHGVLGRESEEAPLLA